MIPRGRLHGLAGDFDRDQNSLTLQPFGGQAVLVIGPLALGHEAPGGRLENDGSKSEFVEGEHAAPFRRVPESSNRVCQYRQDTALGGVHSWFRAQQVLLPSRTREVDLCNLLEDYVRTHGGEMVIDAFTSRDVPLQET